MRGRVPPDSKNREPAEVNKIFQRTHEEGETRRLWFIRSVLVSIVVVKWWRGVARQQQQQQQQQQPAVTMTTAQCDGIREREREVGWLEEPMTSQGVPAAVQMPFSLGHSEYTANTV
ncbi:hypothetical protein PV325_006152 [Microctonus aethiopoides]|nr:hypothetical protein PV325_006152 [Microctonus aethiopoides]